MREPSPNDEIYQFLKISIKKMEILKFSNVVLNRSPGPPGPFSSPPGANFEATRGANFPYPAAGPAGWTGRWGPARLAGRTGQTGWLASQTAAGRTGQSELTGWTGWLDRSLVRNPAARPIG